MSHGPEAQFWRHVREQFILEFPRINLAAMVMAPHHRRVRETIAEHADGLDREGQPYASAEIRGAEARVREAAARYCFSGKSGNIALTNGTLQGLGLLYAGLRIRPDQEILASNHEFSLVYSMFQARQVREGRKPLFRAVTLFEDLPNFSTRRVLEILKQEIRDETRVLALTWVYSNTGVKLPIGAIGQWVEQVNVGRSSDNRLLFCVDGVHGFGVENATFPDLHCDFFVSGCHKWIFGPRGTGIWLGRDDAWEHMTGVIPSTTPPPKDGSPAPGFAFTPGGVHSYELHWALGEAFTFLDEHVGKRRLQDRVHGLALKVKQALLTMRHVRLVSPLEPEHSSGVICFDVFDASGRVNENSVVDRLRREGIFVTTSSQNRAEPDDIRHVRLSPSILNSDDEIDRAIEAIDRLG